MRKNLFLAIIILLGSLLFAETITLEYEFADHVIKTYNNYQAIQFENTVQNGILGEPILPYKGLKVLLPQGEDAASIKITGQNKTLVSDEIVLLPTQPQYALSTEIKPQFIEAVSPVYTEDHIYPEDACYNLSTHYLSGFSLGFASFTPVEYNPVQNEISYYKKVIVEIETKPSASAEESHKYLHNSDKLVNYVTSNVENFDYLGSYDLNSLRTDTIDYLLITDQSKVDEWQPLTDIYANRGLFTEIETVQNILSNFDGADSQEKIRNYLIDMYMNYEIRYVLLAGDVDVIPYRGFYGTVNNGGEVDYGIPSDMYYCCLDGNWNEDGDDKWGEPEESDLTPEFALGRFCYNNNQEISDYINKVQSYLNEPISNEMRTALFVGEYLWDGPTWGGDYMDEMIGGSSTNGHETVGIPADWNISTLYERDGNWEAPQIQAALSNGPNMVNHLGHSNSDYNMKLYTSQVSNSTISNDGNNHNFSIIYSQGCIAGAFEVSDCIAEKFVSISHAAVAMLANSRYGWGMQGSTDGASQFFHREYIDAIFEEDIFDIGYANNDSKIDAIPFMSGNNTVLFWVCYEMNLLGDPALSVWTDTPQDIVATHPANIILGSSEVEISTNVNSAHVAVLLDGEIIGTSNTNLTGNTIVYFDEPVQDTAELSIVVVKHNYNTYEGNITVIPGNGAYVVCNSPEFSESGDYLDGSIQSLDIVDMDVTLVNIGLENSGDNVGAILSTESNFVNIIDNTTETGQIEATGSIILENAFQVELLPGIPDGSYLPFTVEITSGDNTWQSEIFMQVQGPVLEFSNYEMNILDGDDQILDPGESLEIYLYYNNIGSGYSYNVSTTLFTYDPYAVVGGSDMIPQIDPGSQTITTQPFTIEISPSCPSEYSVQIELLAFDIVGSNLSTSFNIPVGLTNHDFEDGLGDWTHSSLSGGYVDQWHLSDNKNHTDNGEYSVKCGGTGSSDYANHTHSGLVTPDIVLLPDSYIKFYHWMDAEIDNSTQAWDGGLIEISTDGENFQGIEPLGGYPYTITPNDESPFPPGIPVFSGSINWQEVELDLSDFSGSVQLRFVFGSDGYVTGEGWYIDDLQVGSYTSSENDYVIPAKAILNQNYPNPFYAASNSRANTTISFSIPEDAFVNLDVFNIKGQLVKTLIDDQVNRGNHEVQWNGTDNSDRPVASGIYFYKLKPDGKFTSVKKMILMK